MKRKRGGKKKAARGVSPLEAIPRKDLLRSIHADLEAQARAAGLAYPEPREKRRKK